LKPEKEFFLSKNYQLDDLDNSTLEKIPNISALITPHAGLDYSGDLCLWAYQRLQPQNYNQIIIFSTNHHSHRTIIPKSNHIDIESLGRQFQLRYPCQLKKSLYKSDLDFSGEHSWLSHLPFLNLFYPDNKSFTLSIYLVGPDFQTLIQHYQSRKYWSKRTLFLFNTDLLHCGPNYGNYCPKTSKKLDDINQQTLESIQNLYSSRIRRDNLCGYNVIQLFIQLSLIHNWKFKDSNYNTSHTINQEKYTEKTNYVGYGTIIFIR
jgi:AmmeMemoRadiSam system protein B